jgi:hypothetical protein
MKAGLGSLRKLENGVKFCQGQTKEWIQIFKKSSISHIQTKYKIA